MNDQLKEILKLLKELRKEQEKTLATLKKIYVSTKNR